MKKNEIIRFYQYHIYLFRENCSNSYYSVECCFITVCTICLSQDPVTDEFVWYYPFRRQVVKFSFSISVLVFMVS